MAARAAGIYRWAALTHWGNLALLAAGGVAGATVDPSVWYMMLPVQALVFWLAGDLPPLRSVTSEPGRIVLST